MFQSLDEQPYSNVDNQKDLDIWLKNLPTKVDNLKKELEQLIEQFHSLQLISNISHINHLRNMGKPYSDVNEGRMAVIAELVALLLIRRPFQPECQIEQKDFLERASKVNEIAKQYMMMADMVKSSKLLPDTLGTETTLQQITNKLKRDETWIRNPGFPDHHFEFAKELFKPLSTEIESNFGFSLSDSIIIRRGYISLVNRKFAKMIQRADDLGAALRGEVVSFRNTGKIPSNSILTKEQFWEFKNLPSKKMKELFNHHFREKVFYQLQDVYALTADELADYLKLDLASVRKFLEAFSCDFNTAIDDDDLIGPNPLLKHKPIVRHEKTYTVPSMSMLTWCVEQTIEEFIKSSNKLSNRYKDIKHDFLLSKGIEYLKQILPGAKIYPTNLYYGTPGKICETDGLIEYGDTLFVIEAKGHRFSTKAKAGNYERTENHLDQLIGDAVAQGKRTIDFIRQSPTAIFKTKKKEIITIHRDKYKEFVTIGLTLEQVGNLTPLMKVSNDLNYFTENEFPWIVSLYDLVVFADFIEIPILFIQYLKRRKKFLEVHNAYVFEEIDLLGYFLSNGLYLEPTFNEAKSKNVTMLAFDNQTDDFNDYYMYKYGHTERVVPKVKSFISNELKALLSGIQLSTIQPKHKIMLQLLEVNSSSMKTLTDYIKKIKGQFVADGEIHDCSICTTEQWGNIGITYMIGSDEEKVQNLLDRYCNSKYQQQHAKLWLGIGDFSSEINKYDIRCCFVKEQ